MNKTLSALALAASALTATGVAQAQTQYHTAVSTGALEATPNPSPGQSVAMFSLEGNEWNVSVPFSGLTSPTVAAHVHCCTPDSFSGTAGVAVPLTGFPTGVTSGDYTFAFDLMDTATYSPDFLSANGGTAEGARDALLEGIGNHTAYLNIHSEQYPAGEIRGFLVAAPIPEPSTYAMFGFGLAGLAFAARRRSIAQLGR